MKKAVCKLCEYTFFDPEEKDEYFVYVDGKAYCVECLKDAIGAAEETRKLINRMMNRRIERMPSPGQKGAVVIIEEEETR